MADKQCHASHLGLFPRHSRLFSFEMERRDQQQQQQQGVAPFSIAQNWQEPVDMYLLRSIGSSIVKPSEGVQTALSGSFGDVCPLQLRKARTSRKEHSPIAVKANSHSTLSAVLFPPKCGSAGPPASKNNFRFCLPLFPRQSAFSSEGG